MGVPKVTDLRYEMKKMKKKKKMQHKNEIL